MHILIAHDGSPEADAAARFVLLFAPTAASRITIVAVHTTPRHVRRADRAIGHVTTEAARNGLTTEVLPATGRGGTSIANEILDRVDRDRIDLVALGAGARTPLSRVIGSLDRALIRRSPAPVLVVGAAPTTIHRLLVCTSLRTPHGADALDPAVRIAMATGASVDVLHVMSQLPRAGGNTDIAGEDHDLAWHRRRGTAEADHLDNIREVFSARGVKAHARLRHGLVVDEIITHARDSAADLVVLGAHGDGHPSWMLEDITERVMRDLTRPVLVLRERLTLAT